MRRALTSFPALAILFLLAACGDSAPGNSRDTMTPLPDSPPPGTTTGADDTAAIRSSVVAAGDTFAINSGAQVDAAGGAFTITFAAVPEDSRCPATAECPEPGLAQVQLALTAPDGEVQHVMIATGPDSVSRATFRNHTIRLVDLSPMPQVGEPSMQRDYTARLLVTRTGP